MEIWWQHSRIFNASGTIWFCPSSTDLIHIVILWFLLNIWFSFVETPNIPRHQTDERLFRCDWFCGFWTTFGLFRVSSRVSWFYSIFRPEWSRYWNSTEFPGQSSSCWDLLTLKGRFQPMGCEMSSHFVAFSVSGRLEEEGRPLAAWIYSRPPVASVRHCRTIMRIKYIFFVSVRGRLSAWRYTVHIIVSTSWYLHEICVMQVSVDSCTFRDTERSNDLKHSDRF